MFSGVVMPKLSKAKDQEVEMDRRRKDRRQDDELIDEDQIDASAELGDEQPARRKKQRRRQIDPTTCERDYNEEEIEFMRALDDYKRSSGRMFPTCSEILEVIRDLGYVRLTEEEQSLICGINEVEEELANSLEAEFDLTEEDETSILSDL